MTDYLKPLPVADVAAWYYRLADSIAKNKSKTVSLWHPYSSGTGWITDKEIFIFIQSTNLSTAAP